MASLIAPATGPLARLVTRIAGRQYGPEIEDSTARLAGHMPLLMAFGYFNREVEKPGRLGRHLKDLASLRAATVAECEFCIDIGSELARRAGLTDEQLLNLHRARESGLFGADELLVIEYSEALTRTPVVVSDDLATRVKGRFDERQIIELAYICALENARARMNTGLGIEPGGFSEGKVCAVPASAAAQPAAGAVT